MVLYKPNTQFLRLLKDNGMGFKRTSGGLLIYTKNGKGMTEKQMSVSGKVMGKIGGYQLPK